jgi:hypothetical protein
MDIYLTMTGLDVQLLFVQATKISAGLLPGRYRYEHPSITLVSNFTPGIISLPISSSVSIPLIYTG